MFFEGNPLNRSSGERKSPDFLSTASHHDDSIWIVYYRGRVLGIDDGISIKIALLSKRQIVDTVSGSIDFLLTSNATIVVLGDLKGVWWIAIDLTNMCDPISSCEKDGIIGDYVLLGARDLIAKLSSEHAAVTGQIMVMMSWHEKNKFLGSTGEQTCSSEGGFKRICDSGVKIYPRTDPVVIACVISVDGMKILLGKMKRSPKGFYSCLSGFVEPCESVQEAVRREVREESGVELGLVKLVDSQPWPIGRGGGCELMIGCIAKALTEEINIQDDEVEDVNWFTREEAQEMLLQSDNFFSPNRKPDSTSVIKKVLPGKYAIAHHLVMLFINGVYDPHTLNEESKQDNAPVVSILPVSIVKTTSEIPVEARLEANSGRSSLLMIGAVGLFFALSNMSRRRR